MARWPIESHSPQPTATRSISGPAILHAAALWFWTFHHIHSLIAKIPSFCLMLALLAIALPQTPNQFFIYICMVGLLGVLGTLLHCFFFTTASAWCCVERLTDWLTGDMETLHRWTLNPSRLFIRFLLRCAAIVQCKRASKHSLTLLVCPIFCRPPMIAHASPRLIMASQARMSKATPILIASRLFTFIPE
jgi:hypothetical protein